MKPKQVVLNDFIITNIVICGIIGLICGVIYSIGGFFVDLFTTGLNQGTALAMLALPTMTLIGLGVGFGYGSIGGFFYNLILSKKQKS